MPQGCSSRTSWAFTSKGVNSYGLTLKMVSASGTGGEASVGGRQRTTLFMTKERGSEKEEGKKKGKEEG